MAEGEPVGWGELELKSFKLEEPVAGVSLKSGAGVGGFVKAAGAVVWAGTEVVSALPLPIPKIK